MYIVHYALYVLCCFISLSSSYYQMLQMWLEEPRLHEETLSLPSLPFQYEPERLSKLFKTQQVRERGRRRNRKRIGDETLILYICNSTCMYMLVSLITMYMYMYTIYLLVYIYCRVIGWSS